MAVYSYDFSDFTSLDAGLTAPNGTTLVDEIEDALLGTPIDMLILEGPDTVDITFSGTVTQATLDAVVAAHTGLFPAGQDSGELDPVMAQHYVEENFTPTLGQVTFILSLVPVEDVPINFLVNGTDYKQTVDFSVSGQTITWLNAKFSMEADDEVLIRYLRVP
jgi:hypothetical protein